MPEAYVQVALDGSGKKVRNVLLKDVVQPDGTRADVYVQCTTIVDGEGHSLDFGETNSLLRRLVREIKALRLVFLAVADVEVENVDLEVGVLDEDDDDADDEGGDDE